jgi:VCBS repeat protein
MRQRQGWMGVVLAAALVGLFGGCAAHRGGGATKGAGAETVHRDEQGRLYTVRRLPKTQGMRIDATHVRTNWGITLDLVEEDPDAFHYKYYEVTAATPAPHATPNAGDRSRIEASYKADVRASDRLRFRSFGNGLPTQGQWRDGFDVADVDGDGKLDIVHGPPRASVQPVPRIYLGDGKGNWRFWRDAKYPDLPYDYGDAAAADLDDDGHVDLVLSSHLRGFTALRGDGKGTFTAMSRGLELVTPGSGAAAPFSSRAFRLVDWNADGRPDILALGEGPRLDLQKSGDKRGLASAATGIALILNQGRDGWRRVDPRDPTDGIFGQAIAVGDVNDDGRPDFVTASGILGRTDLLYLATIDGGWRRTTLTGLRPSSYVRAVAMTDFDGDGSADVAIGYLSYELDTWRTGVDVLLSRKGNTFERRVLMSSPDKTGVFALATGDLNGDSARDLVALTGNGDTLVFLGDGHGKFTREKTPPPAWPGVCRGVHAELRDLDGDGRDEIVEAFAEERSNATGEERCPQGGGITAWKADDH